MLDIDEIGDYRDLLKQYYVQRKLELPLYSYKMMGLKLGLETSQLFRILKKEYHLPTRCIPLTKNLLGLTGRSGEMFEILAAAARTRSKAKQDKLYEMALALRDVKQRKLNNHEFQFLSKWWIPVVRACIELFGGEANADHIVSHIVPAVSREQVLEAILNRTGNIGDCFMLVPKSPWLRPDPENNSFHILPAEYSPDSPLSSFC